MKTHDTQLASSARLALADFLAFVMLAACITLSVGLVLAGTVLLLSGSAQAAQPEREGGLLLKPPHSGTPLAAPLPATEAMIRVAGHVARAKVTQRFGNMQPDWYEGTHAFPLPENAAVDRLRMRIGERLAEGEIREKGKARAAYAQAKARAAEALLKSASLPTNLPVGWTMEGVGGEMQGELVRGAAAARFDLLVGAPLLLLSEQLWNVSRRRA